MPTTYAIPNGRTVMDATLFTGTGSSGLVVNNADTGTTGFYPDLIWIKSRSAAYYNTLLDYPRGTSVRLFSNLTDAESNNGCQSSFNSNGFTLNADAGGVNNSGTTYVAWQWNAGSGTTSSNTNGSITSTVDVNPTAGFSIATFTSPSGGATAYTVGHGLGVAPSLVISKERNASGIWSVYHVSTGDGRLQLQSTAAVTASVFTTAPTSSTIWFPSSYADGSQRVAYCWAPVAGFSQFGSYTGNGSTDGPFIYTGFRPAFIMIKRTDSGGTDWVTMDYQRLGYNVTDVALNPNASYAENSGYATDFVSNGFKLRTTTSFLNGSGATYIYMAFAQNPFKYANAR